MNGLPKEWYTFHIPTLVTTAGPCTVLYDQQIQTYRICFIPQTNIILTHNIENKNIRTGRKKHSTVKESNKKQKYTNIKKLKIARIWGERTQTIPVIVGALRSNAPFSMLHSTREKDFE